MPLKSQREEANNPLLHLLSVGEVETGGDSFREWHEH
jgi:hypothetical protein